MYLSQNHDNRKAQKCSRSLFGYPRLTIFDLIFLDIEKLDYVKVLPECQRLLKKGGLLVADNVGFKDPEEFNQTITEHKAWRSIPLFSFLPLHSPENDALCLALRC